MVHATTTAKPTKHATKTIKGQDAAGKETTAAHKPSTMQQLRPPAPTGGAGDAGKVEDTDHDDEGTHRQQREEAVDKLVAELPLPSPETLSRLAQLFGYG